jgi:hypothetical protein
VGFLPNSTGLLLVNERALKALEEVAMDDFQAFPTEIKMHDGVIIDNYKLINITKRKGVVNQNKSILGDKEWSDRDELYKYKIKYYDKNCLGETNLARLEDTILFVASSKVKEEVERAKLTGLEFDGQWGGVNFIE